ncbi:MAG: hypothetical protein IPJ23_01145 [Ignavibacteriales bacterium]|nr:hypothetical protein [Ignavibacteriales bacterium]
MFENEIKFISDFTLNKVKDLGSFITVEKFLSTDIHPSIKKYVEGEIDYLISEDRKKLIENSLFDYSGTEISNYFTLIGNEIKKTKKISFEDIKNIILQAVSFNANYVVRPKWSLSKLIFGNNKSVSINELNLMLNYTYYYEYLNNVFLAYLSKKKILNVTVTEFELIVNKIDRELFMLHQSKLVDNALYAIADYFSVGGLNKSSVSVESVENFLKEKNLTELLFKLKRAYSSSSKKKVDIEDIRKVLYSTLSIDSPFVDADHGVEVIVSDKHFENPLKDEFIDEKELIDTETDIELNPEIDSAVDESLLETISESNEIQTQDNSTDVVGETPLEVIEEALPLSKPEKSEITNDEVNHVETESKESDENSDILEIDSSNSFEDTELVSELNVVHDDETTLIKSIDEEEVLAHLTEEIEKDKSDEIIILDEKEQEDLLNFYDNELEISIDDDVPVVIDKKPEFDESIPEDLDALEFEHELPIIEELENEIPIEKLDFEKDLLGVDDTQDEDEGTEKTSTETINKKRGDDIFIYLSKKEIDRIIKNLFNSDSEDFANTVEKMSRCNTYEEASTILENIFKYARIKPHSRDASSLSSAVAKLFNV